MIKLISANRYPESHLYTQVDFIDFWDWFQKQSEYELDLESNVVDDLMDRELYVVQFGEIGGNLQYVIDYPSLDPAARDFLKKCLEDRSKRKLIHNANFEYTLLWKEFGIFIDTIWDTMLGLKVLTTGERVPDDFYKLSGALEILFGIIISKAEQTTFDGVWLSDAQIVYAATDVMHMHKIRDYVVKHHTYPLLENVINLENSSVRPFSDVMCNGFIFNDQKWLENYHWAKKDADIALVEFHKLLKTDYIDICLELGFIQKEDECTLNWNSRLDKAKFLGTLYPQLTLFTKPALTKFEPTLPDGSVIDHLLNGDKLAATSFAMLNHREVLEELGFIRKAGDILLNLDSPKQKLQLFKFTVDMKLESTGAEELGKYSNHPLLKVFKQYVGKKKITTSYGLKWIDHWETKIDGKKLISEHKIDERSVFTKGFKSKDGKLRARYLDQILDTGRAAYKQPPIMTLPADEGYKYGNRFREPFEAEEGTDLVAVDFASQEVVIANFLAGEMDFVDGIKAGADGHSISAYKMYGQRWLDVGGDPEGWKKNKDSMDWKKMRTEAKTITFGNIYGMGPHTLSARLDISVEEAESLIIKYFEGFPELANWLDSRARFGVANGYITTAAPFNRRRYFPEWNAYAIDNRDIGYIERRAKNTSVQGSAGDAAKYAMVLIKHRIETEGWGDKVKIVMMLHDCIICQTKKDFTQTWIPIQEELMVHAHCINIPGRYIGADTTVTDHWIK